MLKTGWFHSDLMPSMTSHLVDRMVSLTPKKNPSAVGFLHHQISNPKCIPIIKHPVCIVSISHHLISSFCIKLYKTDIPFQDMLTISKPIMVPSMDPSDGVSIMKINHGKINIYIYCLSLRYTIPDYFQAMSSNFLFVCLLMLLVNFPITDAEAKVQQMGQEAARKALGIHR